MMNVSEISLQSSRSQNRLEKYKQQMMPSNRTLSVDHNLKKNLSTVSESFNSSFSFEKKATEPKSKHITV